MLLFENFFLHFLIGHIEKHAADYRGCRRQGGRRRSADQTRRQRGRQRRRTRVIIFSVRSARMRVKCNVICSFAWRRDEQNVVSTRVFYVWAGEC